MSERVKTEYVDKLESGLNSPIAVSANNLMKTDHNGNLKEEGVVLSDSFAELSPLKSERQPKTSNIDDPLRDWLGLKNMVENIEDDKTQCSTHGNGRDISGSRRKSQRSVSQSPRRRYQKDMESSKGRAQRHSSRRKRSKRDRRSRSTSSDIEPLRVHPDLLSTKFKPIKLERLVSAPQKASSDITPAECETVEMKQQRGIERAKAQLQAFENHRKSAGTFSKFIYTNTVCQIPKKDSLLGLTIGENRSPLSTNPNVEYAFTSMGGRVDLAQYRLQQPTQPVVDLLKIVGMDVNRLEALRAKAKMPPRLLKLSKEESDNDEGVAVGQSVLRRDGQTKTYATPRRPPGCNLIRIVPRNGTEEVQQYTRLIEAIKLCKDTPSHSY